jgi:type IV fimbrial biogenesis protein FimT
MKPTAPFNPVFRRWQRGITAIELLMYLAVAGIVILIAVPATSMLIERHRLKSTSGHLVSGLYLAKSEAQNRASTVKVCPSEDGKSCRTNGNWSSGWVVYSDGNGDGVVQEIELLEAFEAPQGHVRILASGATRDTAAFTATGLVGNNDSSRGEFVICPAHSGPDPRLIEIDADGWVSMQSADSGKCGNS